ncbi:DUF4232 domain-containing protein [Saccharopolyspora pogona]|uniref:DUF4232 domain-containing protein n=1 Tax=Saccharopolyspora pogona TaxID=333966 RepID=UPI0016895131|nr:DUF4232 domain-containing protein [Saccharopolyspora pogona]
MRKRVVGATVALAVGLALSGCAAGGAAQQQTTGGGSQIGSRPIQASDGQQESGSSPSTGSASTDSGGSSTTDRACESSDFDAKFTTHEVYDGGESYGQFTLTKNSNNMTPCVLDGYPEVQLMAGSEGGKVLPGINIKKVSEPGTGKMRLDGYGEKARASFLIRWTTSGDDGGCDMPGAVSVTLPGANDSLEQPVNAGADNSMRVCANQDLKVTQFGE